MPRSRVVHRLIVLACLAVLVGGCSGAEEAAPSPAPQATATQAAASPTPPAATAAPTLAPTPTAADGPISATATPISDYVQTIGGDRPVAVTVPDGYDPASPAPLLLLLHGYDSDGAMQEAYFQLGPVAAQRGLIYAIADGTKDQRGNRFWNAAPVCCDFDNTGVDDSAYLRRVLGEIQGRYSVDPSRVFILGLSNGGFMAHRMACDHADVVTAIVSFAGMGLADAAACEASAPLTVLQIHGDADSGVRYEGGAIGGFRYPGARQTAEDWAARYGCAATPREGQALDLVTRASLARSRQGALDGAETSVAIYDGCDPGGHVELWTMQGADHIPALAPTFSAQVVEFLLAHPRPE